MGRPREGAVTGRGWGQRVKIVVWPLGGRWGNPDRKHSDLRDGEETQEHEGTGASVIQVTDWGCLGVREWTMGRHHLSHQLLLLLPFTFITFF